MITVHFMYSPDGDWMGMYINGNLVAENHTISAQEAVSQLMHHAPKLGDIDLTSTEMVEADIRRGCCPKRFSIPSGLRNTAPGKRKRSTQ